MRKLMGRLWLCAAMTSPVAAAVVACGDEAAREARREAPGTLSMPLAAEGSRGTRYRLRAAEFTIVGASFRSVSSDDFLEQDTMVVELPVGRYSISLGGPWFLERLTPSGFERVAIAALSSNRSVAFSILERTTSNVAFEFDVDGEVVQFGGALAVSISVTESGGSGGVGGLAGAAGASGGGEGDSAGEGGSSGTDVGGSAAGAGGGDGFTSCGDGVLDDGEECDDADDDPCDGCVDCRSIEVSPAPQTMPEVISEDTAWCGPGEISLTNSAVVLQGATLAVGPGLRIAAADGQGIQVRGALRVHGSAESPVVFTSVSPAPAEPSWAGLSIVGEAFFEHVVVEHADTGVHFAGCCGTSRPRVLDSTVRHNGVGVVDVARVERSTVVDNIRGAVGLLGLVVDSTFERNGSVAVGDVFTIRRSRFVRNGGCAVGRAQLIEDSEFLNNDCGVDSVQDLRRSSFLGNNVAIRFARDVEQSLITDNISSIRSLSGSVVDSTFLRNRSVIELARGASLHRTSLCNLRGLELSSRTITVVDATSNWWCTTDSAAIQDRVRDVFDDVNVGPILVEPFLDAPSPAAPVDPGPPAEPPPGADGAGGQAGE